MHFSRFKVEPQIKLLVSALVRDQHLEVETGSHEKVERTVARVVERYIAQYDEIDEKAYKLIAEHDFDVDDYYKRIFYKLAKEAEFPTGTEALDQLNRDIEAALWDDDNVIELFAEPRELVALVTPYLKAMKK